MRYTGRRSRCVLRGDASVDAAAADASNVAADTASHGCSSVSLWLSPDSAAVAAVAAVAAAAVAAAVDHQRDTTHPSLARRRDDTSSAAPNLGAAATEAPAGFPTAARREAETARTFAAEKAPEQQAGITHSQPEMHSHPVRLLPRPPQTHPPTTTPLPPQQLAYDCTCGAPTNTTSSPPLQGPLLQLQKLQRLREIAAAAAAAARKVVGTVADSLEAAQPVALSVHPRDEGLVEPPADAATNTTAATAAAANTAAANTAAANTAAATAVGASVLWLRAAKAYPFLMDFFGAATEAIMPTLGIFCVCRTRVAARRTAARAAARGGGYGVGLLPSVERAYSEWVWESDSTS
ncbi:tropomyosin-1, isoforms 33/34-like [Cyclospora cayetanensis]|uniref:Tropomyosin-1, isoforms 33/34-like n=1 Tax=Cyclospora cayetanensis TaxID=88456 RepID=A0A6P6RYM0_9EIME|nr:tropomyosin-1, isoforms 33/34-like [Cyclospora cayetanensis]